MANDNKQKGQIVVEYVLLMTVALSLALLIISALTKRDYDQPENSGAIMRKWFDMQKVIGADKPN